MRLFNPVVGVKMMNGGVREGKEDGVRGYAG